MDSIRRKHPGIVALGYSEAAMFLRSPIGSKVGAIVSIHGTHEFGIESQISPRLDLAFDDIEAPDTDDLVAVYQANQRQRLEAENGRHRRPPTMEDVRSLVQFAEAIAHVDGIVLCHCGGGVSRAPAAAIICLTVWTGPGHERYCVSELLRLRSCASPHPDLIRFCDTVLGRDGKLIAAMQQ